MICYSLYKYLLVKARRIFKKEESSVRYVPLPSENTEDS